MPKKFNQDTKDRVVRLGGRPHSGGEHVDTGNVQNRGTQTGGARGILPGNGRRRLKTPGYAEKNHKLRDTNELLQTSSAFSRQNQAHNLGYDPIHR